MKRKKSIILIVLSTIIVSVAIAISITAVVYSKRDKLYKEEFKQNYSIVKAEFLDNISLYNDLVLAIKQIDVDDDCSYYINYESGYDYDGIYKANSVFKITGRKKNDVSNDPSVETEIFNEMKLLYDEIVSKTLNGIKYIAIYPDAGSISIIGGWYKTGYHWVSPWVRPNSKTSYCNIAFTYLYAPAETSYNELLNDNWYMHSCGGLR